MGDEVPKNIKTNRKRLWNDLMEMGKIGATPGGGVGRLALTDLDRQARDLFVSWCEAAGCSVRVDRIGNIIARRAGADSDRAPVMTGSHLDTQPLGGKFDGIYGVLVGLEVIRSLNDANVTTSAPLDVVVWTDEEGARFRAGMMGSKVFTGLATLEDALADVDGDGKTVGDELQRIGYAGPETVGGFPLDAFFEAHIEQGPVLEAENKTIGVVLGAQAQRNCRLSVHGEEGHAGTLPMDKRRDALLGAARMIDAINKAAFRQDPWPVVTVGSIAVRPNSPNTIPGQATFTIDSRHPDEAVLSRLFDDIESACHAVADDAGLGLDMEITSQRKAVAFDENCVSQIRAAADLCDHSHRDIYSGAGHDACNLALVAPTGMIFVPCEGGISHNPAENATPEDLGAGGDVLLQAMLARAGQA